MKNILFDEIYKFTPKKTKSHAQKYDHNMEKNFNYDNHFLWMNVIFVSLTFFVFTLFISKALSVQITNRHNYINLADKNRIREFSIIPSRGLIYDRKGNILVRNKPSFSVQLNTLLCDLKNTPEVCDNTIELVRKYINLDNLERVEKQIKSFQQNVLLANGLSKEQIISLESNLYLMPGISIEASPVRDYLYDEIFAHLIGYVGFGDQLTPEVVGITGIERVYNEELSGVMGTRVVQVDASGSSYELITSINPFSGKDITLYVDLDLQKRAYELIKEKVDEDEDTIGGVVVAQDPTNGGVLALVSYPSFSAQKMVSGITTEEFTRLNTDNSFPFYNRAISASYPPGSTFKLVTAAAALEEGITNRYLTINDIGYIQVGSYIFRNWKLDGHGVVNLLRALQVSNDPYFYTIGGGYGGIRGLGIKRLHNWADKFGFGKKTGIDLNSEIPGFMPDGTHRDWYLGDDYISAIGQGDILSTPLQVNNMFTYFANGGYLYEPHVLKSISTQMEKNKVIMGQNLIKEDNYDLIRLGVHQAVLPGGTGWPLFDFSQRHDGIKIAGKTGTSEYIDSSGEERTHAWFSVFGPYKESILDQKNIDSTVDRPIVLTVFLEGGGGGAGDAAPIAKELLDLWFSQ